MNRKGILCFIKERDKVLLIKVDYGKRGLIWNGVSGFIEDGEERETTLIREVKEEIGIDIDIESLLHKGNHRVSEVLDLEIFVATSWQGIPIPQEKSIKEIGLFNINSLPFTEMFPGNEDWVLNFLR